MPIPPCQRWVLPVCLLCLCENKIKGAIIFFLSGCALRYSSPSMCVLCYAPAVRECSCFVFVCVVRCASPSELPGHWLLMARNLLCRVWAGPKCSGLNSVPRSRPLLNAFPVHPPNLDVLPRSLCARPCSHMLPPMLPLNFVVLDYSHRAGPVGFDSTATLNVPLTSCSESPTLCAPCSVLILWGSLAPSPPVFAYFPTLLPRGDSSFREPAAQRKALIAFVICNTRSCTT